MEEHEQKAEELEREADDLGDQGDRVEEDIGKTRSDFEGKLSDIQAPGLLEEEEAAPGGDTDYTGEDEPDGGDERSEDEDT